MPFGPIERSFRKHLNADSDALEPFGLEPSARSITYRHACHWRCSPELIVRTRVKRTRRAGCSAKKKSAVACCRSRPRHCHRFCHAHRGRSPLHTGKSSWSNGCILRRNGETTRLREEVTITTSFNPSNCALLISLLALTGCGTSASVRPLQPSSVGECNTRHPPVTDASGNPQQPSNSQPSRSMAVPLKATAEREHASGPRDDPPPKGHRTDDTPINSGAGNAIPLGTDR